MKLIAATLSYLKYVSPCSLKLIAIPFCTADNIFQNQSQELQSVQGQLISERSRCFKLEVYKPPPYLDRLLKFLPFVSLFQNLQLSRDSIKWHVSGTNSRTAESIGVRASHRS